MLTNGRKRMGSVSEHDSKNCFFSRIKAFFLRKYPWTCILHFDKSARKSPIKYQKILDQGPKVTIKIFPKKFSLKSNWTFWMQFWQIHARKFQKWQTHGPMLESNKKKFSHKKIFFRKLFPWTRTKHFWQHSWNLINWRWSTLYRGTEALEKKQFFFKRKNILLQIVPLDA